VICSTVRYGMLFLVPAVCGAQPTVYVNNRLGDDTADGTGEANPVATIARAIALSHTSGRIALANTGTPYRESFALGKLGGTPEQPFAIVSHSAVIGSKVGVEVHKGGFCHLTLSVIRGCARSLSSETDQFIRDYNLYDSGEMKWLERIYRPQDWAAFRSAAGHDVHSVVGLSAKEIWQAGRAHPTCSRIRRCYDRPNSPVRNTGVSTGGGRKY